MPLASIVIPVWNRVATLERAIASVLAQTERDLEVIVVDNGSDDPTAVSAVVADAADDRVRLVRLDANVGPSGGRNAGIAEATGRLIGVLDSDDELDPEWLVLLRSAIEAHPGCGVATCGFHGVDTEGIVRGEAYPEALGPAFQGATARFQAGMMLIDEGLLRSVGGFDERLWYGENTDLGLRLCAALNERGVQPAVVGMPLMRWHRATEPRGYGQRRLEAAELMLEKHRDAFSRDRFQRTSHLRVAGVTAARLGERKRARRHFGTLLRAQPSVPNLGRFLAATNTVTTRLVWHEGDPRTPKRPRHDGRRYVWTSAMRVRVGTRRARRRTPDTRFPNVDLVTVRQDMQLVNFQEVGTETRLVLPEVRHSRLLERRWKWGRTQRSPARTVIEVQRGQIFGGSGLVGYSDRVIGELGNAYELPEWIDQARLGSLTKGPYIPGRSVSLTMNGFTNYARWTLQGLPRLIDILAVIGGPGTVDRFVYAHALPGFVRESLTRLGISGTQLHRIDATSILMSEELVCAAFISDRQGVPPASIDALRRLYADALVRSGTEVLYVSRQTSARRHVVNQDAVVQAVERLGGRAVSMDGRSVADQASLFSSARLVIAVHGAELANLVFMHSSAAVLELLPVNLAPPVFAKLCRSRGLAYDYVLGVEPIAPRFLWTGLDDADTRVDVLEMTKRAEALLG